MQHKMTKLNPFGILIEANAGFGEIESVDLNGPQGLRQLLIESQLIVLRGFRNFKTADEFASYAERWGQISVWPFGKVMELVEHDKPEDHIFDHKYVPLHWDGMYRAQVPEYQMFHCVRAPREGFGGRTTFSNTLRVLETATPDQLKTWSTATGTYRRKMEFYDSQVVSPVLAAHPYLARTVIRYNEPPLAQAGGFLNPPELKFSGVENESEFHRDLSESLHASDCYYAHEWKTGDVVIADNFSLLHGREEFVSREPRHLRRVHVLSEVPYENPGLESHS